MALIKKSFILIISGTKGIPEVHQRSMLDLLKSVDHEFVPPLSSRESSSTMSLSIKSSEHELLDYLDSLKEQKNCYIMDGDVIIGLASIRENYYMSELKDWSECEYLTTIAVLQSYRRQGLAKKLYNLAFDHTKGSESKKLVTRTWNTNNSHITLANILGLKEIYRIKDHRKPGVDTVYLGISFA